MNMQNYIPCFLGSKSLTTTLRKASTRSAYSRSHHTMKTQEHFY
jgi:hypothetical protein